MTTKQNLETEYLNDNGLSTFNPFNNTNYSSWLENKVIKLEQELKKTKKTTRR